MVKSNHNFVNNCFNAAMLPVNPMSDARIIAECRDYGQLLAGFRSWVDQLNTSFESIDRLALLPDSYTARLLTAVSPKGRGGPTTRVFGRSSLGPFLSATGLMLLIVVDEPQLQAIRHRLPARSVHGPRMRAGNRMQAKRKYRFSNPELALSARQLQIINTTGVERTAIARKAALARWAKPRRDPIGTAAQKAARSSQARHAALCRWRSAERNCHNRPIDKQQQK